MGFALNCKSIKTPIASDLYNAFIFSILDFNEFSGYYLSIVGFQLNKINTFLKH